MEPEKLAERFHELYEYLAPSFGYKTREASAKPWSEVPENNRKLMTTVCEHILKELELGAGPAASDGAGALRQLLEHFGTDYLYVGYANGQWDIADGNGKRVAQGATFEAATRAALPSGVSKQPETIECCPSCAGADRARFGFVRGTRELRCTHTWHNEAALPSGEGQK